MIISSNTQHIGYLGKITLQYIVFLGFAVTILGGLTNHFVDVRYDLSIFPK